MSLSARELKNNAAVSLENAAYDPQRLVLISSGIALGAGVLVNLLAIVLDAMIANTGGLSDLGTRTVLASIRTVAQLAVSLLMPFWTVGLTHCALALGRQTHVGPRDLLTGLRRWGVVVRLALAQAVLYSLIASIAMQLASTIFLMTPMSADYLAVVQTIPLDTLEITEEKAMELLPTALPMVGIFLLVFALAALPVFYRLRMSTLRIMDEDRPGALRAMLQSNRMMKGSCFQLLRLDLSYWWYYAAQFLLSVIVWAPELLTAAGVAVPVDPDLFYLGCYAVYAVLTLGLHYAALARIETTYALFHDTAIAPFRPQTEE